MNEIYITKLLSPWLKNLPNKKINNLCTDSRKLNSGGLFISIIGHKQDGRKFILEAIHKKSEVILYETKDSKHHGYIKYINNVPIIYFLHLSQHVSMIANRFYKNSEKNIKIVGVTGTNGKTTVTHLINQWSEILGCKIATMGTLGNGCYNNLSPTKNTTSSAIEVQSFLNDAFKKNIKLVTMEISSHGLIQNRVKSVPFNIGIFTNLTEEHLDYHKNMTQYALSKWSFFNKHKVKKIILNADDKYGKIWLKKLLHHHITCITIQNSKQKKYSTKWINATHIELKTKNKTCINFESSWGLGQLSSSLIGKFNVTNILLSLACLLELGYSFSDLINTSHQINPVPGRMQTFFSDQKPTFIIDYAHTPDALKQTLTAIKLHYQKYTWCIFGCGGERDKKKRSIMGSISEKIADKVILTNDNPRNENEKNIFQDILKGCKNKNKILIIPNRKKAISHAFFQSKKNHIILIAGKGHEKIQIIKNKKIQYSDKNTVLKLLEEKI